MRTLFLDLASHDGLIACVSDDSVIASMAVPARITDAELDRTVQEILQQADWNIQDLSRLACVNGPGGFTSLRVACAYVSALGFALTIPIAGLHLSELKRAEATAEDFWWLHSTKKDALFIRGFGRHTEQKPEPELVSLSELDQLLQKNDQWLGELIPEQQMIIDRIGVVSLEIKSIEQVLPELLNQLDYKNQTVLPWYGRGW